MSKERQPCQIIENAKIRAKKLELDPREVQCPADQVCDGSACIYNGELVPDMGRIERFELRLQRKKGLKNRLDKMKGGE